MQNEELIRLALENGADKAQVIAQQQIVMSPVFREICESNGCGNYGKCWMCPPDAGDIDALMNEPKATKKRLCTKRWGRWRTAMILRA